MNVGQRIKQRRKELNLGVEDIAKKLNKNKATIYRYESNEIENLPITILEPLSEILETTPSYLMGWDEIDKSNEKKSNYVLGRIDTLLKHFLDTGIIEDIDNMDKNTEEMILSLIKRELKKIKEKDK